MERGGWVGEAGGARGRRSGGGGGGREGEGGGGERGRGERARRRGQPGELYGRRVGAHLTVLPAGGGFTGRLFT